MVDDDAGQSRLFDKVEYVRDPTLAVQSSELKLGLEAWNGLRGDRKMPAPKDIDALLLPRLILPYVSLLEVEWNPGIRFRWRLIGTHVTTMLNRDMTGRYWDEIYDVQTAERLGFGPLWVIENQLPLRSVGNAFFVDMNIKCVESLDMPLSSDGKLVDRLFCMTVFAQD
ncbi:MAG: PAS domain-containing protein [Alphaproteobacteria bacterium]|nr:PAS domain-containing protein [Alphaproteobacteria bacterium]